MHFGNFLKSSSTKAIVIPIKHALISDGEISTISEVLSHPQALAQCSEWISENLPNAISLPTNSTSSCQNGEGSKFRAPSVQNH